jgi:hypothetical protein
MILNSLLDSLVGCCNTVYIKTTGRFFPCLNNKCRPDALVSFIRLSKSYFQCVFLGSPRHRLLKLPETRREL